MKMDKLANSGNDEYYTEIVSCVGELKNEEERRVAYEISNKLAVFSVKYNVIFEINIK